MAKLVIAILKVWSTSNNTAGTKTQDKKWQATAVQGLKTTIRRRNTKKGVNRNWKRLTDGKL